MAGGGQERQVVDEALDRALKAYHNGRFYEAESILFKLIWTMKLTPEDHILARTLLGNSLRKMGRTMEAEKELRKAVEIANSEGKASTQGDLLLSMGKLRFRKGELDLANDLLNQALEYYKKMGNNRGVGQALVDIGSTNVLMGRYEAAEERFNEAIEYIGRSGERIEHIRALHNLAYVHFHQKDYYKAKKILFDCLEMCKGIEDQRLLIHTYSNLAHINILTHDLDKAAENLSNAGRLLDRTEDRMCRLNVRWVQGLLMGAEGQVDAALSVFEEIGAALEQARAASQVVELILDYIPLLVRARRFPTARELLGRARGIAEERFHGHYIGRIEDMDALIRKADS